MVLIVISGLEVHQKGSLAMVGQYGGRKYRAFEAMGALFL